MPHPCLSWCVWAISSERPIVLRLCPLICQGDGALCCPDMGTLLLSLEGKESGLPSTRHEYTGSDEGNQRPSGAISLPITSHLAELLPASHFPGALRETLRLSAHRSDLAPTDVDEHFVRLLPIGRPRAGEIRTLPAALPSHPHPTGGSLDPQGWPQRFLTTSVRLSGRAVPARSPS